MAKAILKLGYQSFILDAKDGVAIMEILMKGERYERHYRKNDDGNSEYTHHVWQDESEGYEVQFISDSLYNMAKLAGKRERD